MIALMYELIAYIDEVSGHDDEHFLVGFEEKIGVWYLQIFIDFKLIQVGFYLFLEIQIASKLDVILGLHWNSVEIDKSCVFSLLVLPAIHLQRKGCLDGANVIALFHFENSLASYYCLL